MKFLSILITIFAISASAEGISFNEDIRPILRKACNTCHNSENKGLPNVLEYPVAFSLKTTILKRVSLERSMPYSGRLTESERDLIKLWVDIGAKE